MIDVYIREIEEVEGHLLGAFQPHQLNDIPKLIKLYTTSDPDGRDCSFYEARFVLEGGAFFEIIVEANGAEPAA